VIAASVDSQSSQTDIRYGFVAAALVFAIYGGLALSVDFPRAAFGFQSDESTYYMMGHSLAEDGDFTYRREDLVRVWEEFPGGPAGVFLKRGRDVQGLAVAGAPPFVALASVPDPDTGRLYYGKSFAYPLVAAPFVALFGTNGFLLLHAILLALMTLAGFMFLNARSRPLPAVLIASAFIMASVAPAYFVWITPEIFNLALATLAYFCWLYKEVAPADRVPRGGRWLLTPTSDLVAVVLLGLVTFSKPSNALMAGPLLFWQLRKRQWASFFGTALIFALVVGGLFAMNIAISGDWNFQGGDRRTFYGGYPFQTPAAGFGIGMDRATNEVLTDVIFGPNFWTLLTHNLGWFFVGRYSGLLAYFFPAVFALGTFLFARRRPLWQYLVLAVVMAEIVLLVVWIPNNYFGGGGVLGNRYFMNVYGLFLFLLPPIESVVTAVVPWIVGSLFAAKIVLNPFYASFHPAEHAKAGPLRLLPVELSLFNDLPVMTDPRRVRLPFGTEPRFQITFLDDNAYIEDNAFWVKGDSRADILVRFQTPANRLVLSLAAGEVTADVTVWRGWTRRTSTVRPGQIRELTIPLDEGFPYQASRIWKVSIETRGGFLPMFGRSGSTDNRYLGIRVTPELR
jgi:hypothetical protein